MSLLSLTFGCPVAVGRAPVSEDLRTSGLVRMFEAGDDDDMIGTLTAAIDADFVGPGDLDPAFADRHDPRRVSAAIAENVLRIAGERPA